MTFGTYLSIFSTCFCCILHLPSAITEFSPAVIPLLRILKLWHMLFLLYTLCYFVSLRDVRVCKDRLLRCLSQRLPGFGFWGVLLSIFFAWRLCGGSVTARLDITTLQMRQEGFRVWNSRNGLLESMTSMWAEAWWSAHKRYLRVLQSLCLQTLSRDYTWAGWKL